MQRNKVSYGGSSVLRSAARFMKKAHALDYICLALLVTGYILTQALFPFHRLFSPQDPAIQYPFAEHERVPFVWLMIDSVAVPGVVIFLYCLVTRSAIQKFHVALLGLGLSLMSAALVTNIFKNGVGRPRPDLLSRCMLSVENAAKSTLMSVENCESINQHTLQDGWRSFPSGHSSFAFSGLGYLSFFLTGQLHVLRGGSTSNSLFTILCLIPLLGAGMVAVSRLEDYRHATEDVIAGSTLGFLCAWAAYRRFFPTLTKRGCSVPHPSLENDGSLQNQRQRDVETGRDEPVTGEEMFELDDVVDDDDDYEEGIDGQEQTDGRGKHVPLRSTDE